MLSTTTEGLVLGFSFTSGFIPAGEGVLTTVNWTHTGADAYLDLSITNIAGPNGSPLSFENGTPFCYGICDPTVITYNVYRDASLFTEGLDATEYVDEGLGYSETHCYTVTASDGTNESSPSNEACATTVSESADADSLALVAFYNSTSGDGWTNNTGWLTDTLFCNWYGITCSDGYVTQISFYNNNLLGSIPSELGNLTNLQVLHLYNNQLSGSIPSDLGNLMNLTYLELSYNQLTGSIPPDLGSLTNLELLLLYNNQLSGSIPSELGNLTNLQRLYLSNNQLTGSIPLELSNLTNLQYLYLSNNQLTGSIPLELSNLT
ncbi:MAG: leucine-rich repeat domain-containing protein, partial [Candidatus Marinimicrobia bacterium]|nr:leucine-rich repeat domain-containing protein [Candidatus Neomarinimicrobiota bacterium]